MHVLATELATLEEADVAVDLGQSPAEIVVLSFSDSDLSALAAAWQQDADMLPTLRLASLKRLQHPMSVDLYVETVVARAKIVIVRCLGGLDYWRYGLEHIADAARDNGVLFAALPGDDRADPRLAAVSTLAAEPLGPLDRFFREGGADNLRQALRYVATLLGRDLSWSPPAPVGPLSILGAAPDNGRPVALVVFYRANLVAADIAPVTALMEALDRQGLAPLAVAVSSLKDPAIRPQLEGLIAAHRPAIIVNTTAFSAMRDDDTTVLDAADVPVLQVVLSGSTREAWRESGARPVARRSRHERRAARARRPPADARHLLQGRSADRSAAGIRQRAPRARASIASTTSPASRRHGPTLGTHAAQRTQARAGPVGLPGARWPRRLRGRPRHDGERGRDPEAAADRRLRHWRARLAGGRHRAPAAGRRR